MRRFLSWLISGVMAFLVFRAAVPLFFQLNGWGLPVALIGENMEYLKYFTVLSNLWMGFAALFYCVALARVGFGRIRRVPLWVARFKYIGVSLTALTFLTALCYIGPKNDFATVYADANLWFHLIIPLLAAIDFTALDRERDTAKAESLLVLPPIAAYCLFYIGNLILNGYGGKGHPNDWYGFCDNGPQGVYIAIAALLLAGWLIAFLLGRIHNWANRNTV